MTRRYPDPAAPGERVALFPGSFNPFTIGHLDILERGLAIFDRVIIVVGCNRNKPSADAENALEAIRRLTAGIPRADAMIWDGLTADAAKSPVSAARCTLGGRLRVRTQHGRCQRHDISRPRDGHPPRTPLAGAAEFEHGT